MTVSTAHKVFEFSVLEDLAWHHLHDPLRASWASDGGLLFLVPAPKACFFGGDGKDVARGEAGLFCVLPDQGLPIFPGLREVLEFGAS